MDISQSAEPRSDQQNFDDYSTGSKVVTVADVTAGTAEQPVNIELVEFPGRPYKPSKSMRRVLIAAWGSEASAYVGRKMELYGDPTVKFGGKALGGIKIAKLSNIDGPMSITLTVTRGQRAPHKIEPLIISPAEELAAAKKHLWQIAQSASSEPLDWLNIEAATHGLSLDAPDDVQKLIGVLTDD